MTEKIYQIITEERYQGHANALIKAGLAPKIFPSLKEIWKKSDTSKLINYTNQENRSGVGRNMYFCFGFSNIWRVNIHIII